MDIITALSLPKVATFWQQLRTCSSIFSRYMSPCSSGQPQGWDSGKYWHRLSPASVMIWRMYIIITIIIIIIIIITLQMSYSQLPTPSRHGTVMGKGSTFCRSSLIMRSEGRSSRMRVWVFM